MMKKLALGLVALSATFYSCSSDDATGNEPVNPGTGQTAYMHVNITDANQLKGRLPGDYEYGEYGTEAENMVNSAHFYFYNAAGVFVTEANIWTGGTASDKNDDPNGNIEYKGDNVLVLQGLTATNMPTYVVTVLNKPATFEPGNTLAEMEEALTTASTGIDGGVGSLRNFIMTTTSFFGTPKEDGDRYEDKYYFATKVKSTDFTKEPTTAQTTTPVNIYVERLAAKVTLKISEDLKATDGYYELEATIAGDDNGQIGGSDEAGEKIYVKFNNWGLTAVSKQSYIFKNLVSTWNDNAPFADWNNANDYRSHWAKSTAYGQSNWNKFLNFTTYNDAVGVIGSSQYCAENTNSQSIIDAITDNKKKCATHILLDAEFGTKDGDGKIVTGNYVRYNGVLFKESAFLAFVLNNVTNQTDGLNAWIKKVTTVGDNTTTTYTQLGTDKITLESLGNGFVKPTLVAEAPTDNDSWAKITTQGKNKLDKDGNVKPGMILGEEGDFEAFVKGSDEVSAHDQINNTLAKDFSNAEGFNGGKMRYLIPIEHWIKPATSILEGMYGVVRNHHYYVTITKLVKLGHGVFDPDEIIVPGGPGDDDPSYAIGARINILSWKIMNQSVEL